MARGGLGRGPCLGRGEAVAEALAQGGLDAEADEVRIRRHPRVLRRAAETHTRTHVETTLLSVSAEGGREGEADGGGDMGGTWQIGGGIGR